MLKWSDIPARKGAYIFSVVFDKSLEEVEQYILLLSCIFNKEKSFYEKMPLVELFKEVQKLPLGVRLEAADVSIPRQVTLGGEVVTLELDFKKHSTFQMLALKKIGKQIIPEDMATIMDAAPKIATVLALKTNDKNEFDRLHELFLANMSIQMAYNLAIFFLNVQVSLMTFLVGFSANLKEMGDMIQKGHQSKS